MRTTLKELRAFGLDWPPGPVDPPADEDQSFDLLAEAIGCESLYHDFKGDSRYREQKALFEELAAKLAKKDPPPKPAPKTVRRLDGPVTPAKLSAFGLSVPPCLYIPEYPHADIDLERVHAILEKDLREDRRDPAVVRREKDAVEALMRRLDELDVRWRTTPRAAAPPPRIELPITKRKLAALGLEWPWPYPFELDDALDLERAMTDLTYGDVMDYVGGKSAHLDAQRADTKAIIQRLEELGIPWKHARARG